KTLMIIGNKSAGGVRKVSVWDYLQINGGMDITGNVGIGTSTPQAKLQVANGAIMPSAGNSENAGIMFPKDPGGGSGDAAWIRYYARTGEATTFEIGTSNDADDHIALMPSLGNVGIRTINPQANLHVFSALNQATLRIQAAPTNKFGSGRIEFWSDTQGSSSEWRPGFIQSTDQGGFTGGLAFFVNGTGLANKTAEIEVMRITNGNVGIGTQSPEALLHVFSPDPTFGGNVKLFPTDGKRSDFSYDGGNDGIFAFTNYGKDTGDTRFQWQKPDNSFVRLLQIKNNGQVIGNFVQSSSRELKENITDFSTQEAIEALANLNPVKFNYREDNQKQLKAGFIAEDVPELVATADRKAICALDIVAVLTKVIKQQQEELSCLKERLNALEAAAS
ncbi:tail fiber domain-containing protein, partial [Nodularia spumigena CS-590/02]|uniref:tail fiber domain-containing protein n=1 Tax=Nodularia spumigena TaxID=70799 RepID=UPI00232FEC49